MNSEIAYLGFEGGKHLGDSGLAYSGGDGSILKNDNIHDMYFAFYSIGVGHMIIENNIIRSSGHYGLDPHTGTHDMTTYNGVYMLSKQTTKKLLFFRYLTSCCPY